MDLLRKYITINGKTSLEKDEIFSQSDNNTIKVNGIKGNIKFFF
jgi:hypothetical protein